MGYSILNKRFKLVLIFVAATVPVMIAWGVREHLNNRKEEELHFYAVLNNVEILDNLKEASARDRLTNGYPFSWNDLEGYCPTNPNDFFGISDEKYILNPVGAPCEVQLGHSYGCLARGAIISAEYAQVLHVLYAIDSAKKAKAASAGLKKGDAIPTNGARGYLPPVPDSVATYVVNPVGVPPQAKLTKSLPGFPAGTEVFIPNQ